MNPSRQYFGQLRRVLGALGITAILSTPIMAAEAAFPPTAPGTFEVKTLPAGMLLKATASGSYFDNGGRLFGPLFRYISSHDIAMTTPVEATIDDAAMMFWVAPSEVEKVAGSKDGVEVIEIPERTVAVRGAKGGYNKSNYEETRAELQTWLAAQIEWQATGDAYGVYWNGPFTPWFLKAYEVHIPVERVPGLAAHRWKDRVLMVETPTRDDADFTEQQRRFDANAGAMQERELVVETSLGAAAFRVTLIGKDGGQKWRQSEPLDMETLFALIDGMPMRQAEMREQKE